MAQVSCRRQQVILTARESIRECEEAGRDTRIATESAMVANIYASTERVGAANMQEICSSEKSSKWVNAGTGCPSVS